MVDEDVRLMLAFRDGDDRAFDALFERWAGRILRFVERMVGESSVAEDLVQETFVRLWRARERYQPEARFSTWLFTIAKRLYMNACQKHRPTYDSAMIGAWQSSGARPEAASFIFWKIKNKD